MKTWADEREDEDEWEMRDMLLARGSDLSENGTYGDELARRLGLDVVVFLCHAARPPHGGVPVPRRPAPPWHRYSLHPQHGSIRDVVARSHAAAAAVLLTELLVRRGLEVPADLAAFAARALTEHAARWAAYGPLGDD